MADCPSINVASQSLQIRMPGGATLQVLTPEVIPSNLQVTKNLLSQASSALSPLTPLFSLIDAMLAVKAFAEAVPGVITDPTTLIRAITDLIQKISALAKLIPQLSVPFLIVDLIDLSIAALDGTIDELDKVVAQETAIAAAVTKAQSTNNSTLLQITVCADGLNLQVKGAITDSLNALNSLFTVINLFMSLLGLDPIPSLDNIDGSASEIIESLSAAVDALQVIRDAIPIP